MKEEHKMPNKEQEKRLKSLLNTKSTGTLQEEIEAQLAQNIEDPVIPPAFDMTASAAGLTEDEQEMIDLAEIKKLDREEELRKQNEHSRRH
jgi:hypothetical protein